MKHQTHILLLFLALILSINLFGCDSGKPYNPLYVDPGDHDFSQNPELLDRIKSGPHGYFRFINIQFSAEICRRFANTAVGTSSLNLHGDAHIEQYAVTDLGRGLTDFDDSATGPGIIDWMRFGVSLTLASHANGWQESSDRLFGEFLRGYRDALQNPELQVAEPAFAKNIRSTFKTDRTSYLEWIDSIMQPMPQDESDSLLSAMQTYVTSIVAENPKMNLDYFNVVKLGSLKMGIGSALDMKFLVQVKGKSEEPGDDVILEIKEVRDLSGIDCINTSRQIDPFRILLGQARIAYTPFRHLGYFNFRNHYFWVHAWVDNCKEVKIHESFQSPEGIAEIAYDAGVQLGLGHVKLIAAPLDAQLRREQRQLLEKHEEEIRIACAGQIV